MAKKKSISTGRDSVSGLAISKAQSPAQGTRTAKPSGVNTRKAGSGRHSTDPGQMSDTLFTQKLKGPKSRSKEIGQSPTYGGRKAWDASGMADLPAGTIKPRGNKGRKKLHG